MPVSAKVGDHVVFLDNMNKPIFAKIDKVEKDNGRSMFTATAVGPALTEALTDSYEFTRGAILANVGTTPRNHPDYNHVYGVSTAIVEHKRTVHDIPCFFYPKWEDRLLDYATARLRDYIKYFKQTGKLSTLDHPLEIVFHIFREKIKLRGYYAKNKQIDRIGFNISEADFNTLDFIIAHEFGHRHWYRTLEDELKLEWIKKFTESTDRTLESDNFLQVVKSNLVDVKGKVSALDDNQQLCAKRAFALITKEEKLTRKQIVVLFATKQVEVIDQIWPKAIAFSDKRVIVTDYALKNVHELYADSFALYHTRGLRKRLSSDVRKLLEQGFDGATLQVPLPVAVSFGDSEEEGYSDEN